jgi:copper chaperone CopZ
MDRRNFIWTVAATSGAGLALQESRATREKPAVEKAPVEIANVVWTVSGFSCVTCAVGLETLLKAQKGITAATALYPSGRVQIEFDPNAIALSRIRSLVDEFGFKIENA